jgi:hypothetical protein
VPSDINALTCFRSLTILWALLASSMAYAQSQGGTITPGPEGRTDPTLLTTQAQEKASIALRELFDTKFKAFQDEVDRQKATLDSADTRLIKRIDDIPAVIDAQLLHLQKLMEEKFKGVDQQFAGRDVALAAALLAQKTSVDEQNKANAASSSKQDAATTKQIDGIQSIILANTRATDDKIEGVKVLLSTFAKTNEDKITELRSAISDLRTITTAFTARGSGQTDLWAYMVAGTGLLLAFLGFLLPKLTTSSNGNGYQQQAYYPQQPRPQVSVVPVVPVSVPPH